MRLPPKVIALLKTNDVAKLRSLQVFRQSLGLCDTFGCNLLHLAIRYKKMEAFEYLLSLDEVHKSKLNRAGYSPLMYAIEASNDNPVYAIKLIESGCELSMFLPDGDSAIHRLVRKDWPDVIEVLIEKGANVDMKNKCRGETALQVALKLGHIDIVWMLLFYGADPNITSDDNFTLFDLIYTDEAFFDKFSNFDKNFNLMTFVRLMEDESDTFYKLIDVACDLNYTHQDLRSFAKFLTFNPRMVKIFVRKFGYIIEEIFQTSSLLELVCMDSVRYTRPRLQNVCENLFTLIESDIFSTIVDGSNKSQFLSYLICNFEPSKKQLELLTQILCNFLSYGLIVTSDLMHGLYSRFGYCDLFKIMLHMDIAEHSTPPLEENAWPGIYFNVDCVVDINANEQRPPDAWPGIIYNVGINVNDVIGFIRRADQQKDLSVIFTVPELDNRVPSLLELARNASRSYIIDRYQTRNSMQFYTILDNLPIAEEHKRIISFERELYPPRE